MRPLWIQKHDRYWLIGRRTGTKQAPEEQQSARNSGNLYPTRPTRQDRTDLAVRYFHILQLPLDRWQLVPLQPPAIGDRVSKNRSDLLCVRIHRRPYFVSRQALRRRLSQLTVAAFPSGWKPQAGSPVRRLGSLACMCVWPGAPLPLFSISVDSKGS